VVTPAARREALAHLRASLEVSERRACAIIATDRSTVRYRARRPDDAVLRTRLRELADQRRRFGYRRLHILLRNKRWTMNRKEDPADLPRGGPGGAPTQVPPPDRGDARADPAAGGPNSRWSPDFVHDQLAWGCRFRVLTIIDDVTKECLAAVPDSSLSGKRVVRELQAVIARRGKPGVIVSENGTEVTPPPCSASSRRTSSTGATSRPGSRPKMPSPRASRVGCATSVSTSDCSFQ
jgi:putative transposase